MNLQGFNCRNPAVFQLQTIDGSLLLRGRQFTGHLNHKDAVAASAANMSDHGTTYEKKLRLFQHIMSSTVERPH